MRNSRGQAMTEMVLLMPIFLIFLFGFVKVFSMLILYQKVEIAAVYAATRWQFESHRNVDYKSQDERLRQDIQSKVMTYLGFRNYRVKEFLDLDTCRLNIDREAIWSTVTLRVQTLPFYRKFKFLQKQEAGMRTSRGLTFVKVKYVPSRDRPISYILPGGD